MTLDRIRLESGLDWQKTGTGDNRVYKTRVRGLNLVAVAYSTRTGYDWEILVGTRRIAGDSATGANTAKKAVEHWLRITDLQILLERQASQAAHA